jgi:CubicO group peptidase (beta-lactamase class C family)
LTLERSQPVTVWHLLSHTSGEPPGSNFRYDGGAFAMLTQVIERVTGRPFAAELADRIIRPLGLTRTAPYPGDVQGVRSLFVSIEVAPGAIEEQRAVFDKAGIARAPIQAALAQGYARVWARWVWPSGLAGPMRPLPHGITLSTTGGLVASATDVTVQRHDSVRLIWHYGHMLGNSALIVKVPERRVTFVILANSDGLSRWRSLGDEANVLRAPAAVLFLKWLL